MDRQNAAWRSEKIRSGGNQGGRPREQKIVRVRVRALFERFLYNMTKLFQDEKPRSRSRSRSV